MDKLKYNKLLNLRLSQEMLFYKLISLMKDKTVQDVIEITQISRKRAIYILQKWCYKGYYDYGTNIEYGWLTDKFPTWDIRR